MRTRLKLALLATAILSIIIFRAQLFRACGPFFPKIIFTNTLHPDLPIGPYTNGNLGVIQPTYANIYLYVAYCNLAGLGIRPDKQTALWDDNPRLLTGKGMWPANKLQKQVVEAAAHPSWVQKWGLATGQFFERLPVSYTSISFGSFNHPPWPGIYKKVAVHESWGVSYSQYLNCPQDAFHNAVSTLQQLSHQFGATSPVVKNWIQAQETVFGNCNDGNQIPEPLPSTTPAIARNDRAYQIAAAHFYAGDYDQAASEFHAIAQNESSPWNTIAPYLVARSLVRKATMTGNSKVNRATLAQAEAQVDAVLWNPRYAKYHHAAEQLRGYIEFRLHPRQRLVELAQKLSNPRGDPNLGQDVIDFKLLLDRAEDGQILTARLLPHTSLYSALADVRAKSDLLDWLLSLKLGGPEAYSRSLEKWESTRMDAWLVAALMEAAPDSPHVSELLAAASARVHPGFAPFDSLTFYSLRLMLLQGKESEVRQRLASLDLNRRRPKGLPPPRSAVNLYLAMRFKLARNLDELFATAPRVPAIISDTVVGDDMPAGGHWGIDPSEPRLDDDAVMVFNRYLPLALLAKAVHSPKLPENLRRQIALAAWTRAALLGDSAVARSLAPAVEILVPELAPSVRSYSAQKTPAARHFAGVFAALRFPGLSPFIETYGRADWKGATPLGQINNYRKNWWGTEGPLCAPPNPYTGRPGYPPAPQWPQLSSVLESIYPGGKMMPPAFLTAREDAEAASEWQRLNALGPAPDYLSAQILAWAKAHPSDPRVPEALALAVRATRFGCTDQETGKLSKAAFELLHSRYPNSIWAKKTKYWFKM